MLVAAHSGRQRTLQFCQRGLRHEGIEAGHRGGKHPLQSIRLEIPTDASCRSDENKTHIGGNALRVKGFVFVEFRLLLRSQIEKHVPW
ncbi:hypothetical protein NDU88_004579 [Pleurodeles waltl]|uniref:Uncharacterized protein n=1 Tax=Pleurodeles waltl TaxID=8319 RepID=A0AAV7LLR5_PLEWA|nr:hypothetical protein NDU88_004579 [Pleurodeles waltl]